MNYSAHQRQLVEHIRNEMLRALAYVSSLHSRDLSLSGLQLPEISLSLFFPFSRLVPLTEMSDEEFLRSMGIVPDLDEGEPLE